MNIAVERIHLLHACTIALTLFLSLPGAATAQADENEPPDHRSSPEASGAPLAQFVPASAGAFLQTDDFESLQRHVRAGRWYDLLAIFNVEGTAGYDLERTLARMLRNVDHAHLEQALSSEIAWVARSWEKPDSAVCMIRVKDANVAEQWFPEGVRSKVLENGPTRFFATDDGLIVCTRDDVMALREREGSDALLNEIMRLMLSASVPNLLDKPAFQQLTADLPPEAVATIYLSEDESELSMDARRAGFLPTHGDTAIGFYSHDTTAEVQLRTQRGGSDSAPLRASTIDLLAKLPRDTAAAWATSLSARSSSLLERSLARYALLLAALARTDRDADADNVSNQCVVIWGAPQSKDDSVPQITLLLASPDATRLRDRAADLVEQVTRSLTGGEGQNGQAGPRFQRTQHDGTTILRISFDELAARNEIDLLDLMRGVDLSLAAHDEWFMLSLSSRHLTSVLDALSGGGDGLDQATRRMLDFPAGNPRTLAFGRLGEIQPTLQRWIGAAQAGEPSLLSDQWWAEGLSSGDQEGVRLGIAVRSTSRPGTAVVARVDSTSPAHGLVKLNDWIVGVDGSLLDLDDPTGDLRERLRTHDSTDDLRLRVLRRGGFVDVAIPFRNEIVQDREPAVPVIEAVTRLALAGEIIETVSLAVWPASSDGLAATVRLRMRPELPASSIKTIGIELDEPEE